MENHIKKIEELLLQKGEKKGYYFVGDITTSEVLQELKLPVIKTNHVYILNIVRAFHPKSSFEEYSEEKGYIIHIRIRTK